MKNISNITKIETSLDLEGMSLAEAKSAVDNEEKIFQKYNAESYGIIIANSDPLDHPDLDAVIDYIASKNISVCKVVSFNQIFYTIIKAKKIILHT